MLETVAAAPRVLADQSVPSPQSLKKEFDGKRFEWRVEETVERPRVVGARIAPVLTKDNLFGQVVVRLSTLQVSGWWGRRAGSERDRPLPCPGPCRVQLCGCPAAGRPLPGQARPRLPGAGAAPGQAGASMENCWQASPPASMEECQRGGRATFWTKTTN